MSAAESSRSTGAARSVGPSGPDGPSGPGGLRAANTVAVLAALRDLGVAGRARLAQHTGLAKATVGSIVTELTELGAVVDAESPPVDGRGRGRPAAPVRIADGGPVGVGIEINLGHVAMVALDLAGRVVGETERPLPGPPDVDTVAALVTELIAAPADDGHRVLGTTVAVPGLVDPVSGHVAAAPTLGWDDLPLSERLAAAGAGTVGLDNDANCAAVAEAGHGAGAGSATVVYLTGGAGIGAGIIEHGRLLRGSRGFAGEIGHLPLGEPGARCSCGRIGCWEASIGLPAAVGAVGGDPADYRGLDPWHAGRRLAADLDAADLASGERGPSTMRIERLADHLAEGCLLLAGLYDPDVIVLGGFFAGLGGRLVPAVERRLTTRLFTQPPCRVAPATLGLRAAALGAATTVVEQIYAGRLALASQGVSSSVTHR